MVKYPKITFYSDSKKEASYIAFIAKGIQLKEYQKANFLVLPYSVPNLSQSVFFPDLKYSSHFWYQLSKCPHNDLIKPFPKQCIYEIESKSKYLNQKDNIKTISTNWKKIELNFWNWFTQNFSYDISKIKEIQVLVTNYGTCGSYYPQSGSIYATFRPHDHIVELLKTISMAIYRQEKKSKEYTGDTDWQKKQDSFDFIFSNSPFILSQKSSKPKLTTKMYNDSQKYLTSLGFNYSKTPLQLSQLTPKQKNLFELLYSNKNRLITFSEASDAVWGDQSDDKFSLYALAKIIQELRRKLNQNKNHSLQINTFRGQGYLLSE